MRKLKISHHKPLTLVWWYNHRNEIDFNPPYQRRGRLWSADDKAYLIDSIINGFDIPKLYLADFQFGQSNLNERKLPYAIIDGKQRLEAVFDFFENKFVLRHDCRYRKNETLPIGGLSLKDLKRNFPGVAEDFENASLDIMSVFADSEIDINEIFVRLNKSKPLTGAEVRNAVAGQVSNLIRSIASHSFFIENIKFSVSRAADLNAAAKILLFEYAGEPTATKKADLDSFASSDVDKERLELAGRRTLDTLSIMSDVFIPKDQLLAFAGIIPVYYWFIRNIGEEKKGLIRRFIGEFEDERRLNRDRQRDQSDDAIEKALVRFDTLNRSTNDLQSHIGRFEILESHFEAWLKNKSMQKDLWG